MSYRKRASMTIELSLLMPGILAVLILIIFTGYYLHDKVVIERAAYVSVLRSAKEKYKSDNANINRIIEKDDNEICSLSCMCFDDEVEERLIGIWDISRNAYVLDEEVVINVKGRMNCLSGVLSSYLSGVIYTVDITENAYMLSGTKYVYE